MRARLTVRRFLDATLMPILMFGLFSSTHTLADDIKVYYPEETALPNVLIVLDASNSMARRLKGETGEGSHVDGNGDKILNPIIADALEYTIANIEDVKLGLMSFRGKGDRKGAQLLLPIDTLDSTTFAEGNQTHRTTLRKAVRELELKLGTPTVSGLHEAALYFGGEKVQRKEPAVDGAVSRGEYRPPVLDRCNSNNYIIFVTDGKPTVKVKEKSIKRLVGKSCGTYRDFGKKMEERLKCGRELIDALAHKPGYKQFTSRPVYTFTVGLGIEGGDDWLEHFAERGRDPGLASNENNFFSLSDGFTSEDLGAALKDIFNQISQIEMRQVIQPVPTSNFQGLANKGDLYLGVFDVAAGEHWKGNVHKYRLTAQAEIVDANNVSAVGDDGYFKQSALGLWTKDSPQDGGSAGIGGARENLPEAEERKIYTYLKSSGTKLLADQRNAFHVDNVRTSSNPKGLLHQNLFGFNKQNELAWLRHAEKYFGQSFNDMGDLSRAQWGDMHYDGWGKGKRYMPQTDTGQNDYDAYVVKYPDLLYAWEGMSAPGINDYVNNETTLLQIVEWARDGKLMDPLHTSVQMATYDQNRPDETSYVFYGDNGGFFRVLNAATGRELFSFIPEPLLKNLEAIKNDRVGVRQRYGVDGPISVAFNDKYGKPGIIDSDADGEDSVHVYFGLRRGSDIGYVFALDVTNIRQPKMLWTISAEDRGFESLGQTWSRVVKTQVAIKDKLESVLVFGGGYDTDKDSRKHMRKRLPDDVGNALFMVRSSDGKLLWSAGKAPGHKEYIQEMKYSIPGGLRVIDLDRDGLADRFYFGDTGGQLWRCAINNGESVGNLVDCSVMLDHPRRARLNRRFYETPDVSMVKIDGENKLSIALGTGNRANPRRRQNGGDLFVAMHDSMDKAAEAPKSVRPFRLFNTTRKFFDPENASSGAKDKFNRGWLIQLGRREKVLSSATTFAGVTYFTTYTHIPSGDVCGVGQGESRLYSIQKGTTRPPAHKDGDDTKVEHRYRKLTTAAIAASPALFRVADEHGLLPAEGAQLCVSAECEVIPGETRVEAGHFQSEF